MTDEQLKVHYQTVYKDLTRSAVEIGGRAGEASRTDNKFGGTPYWPVTESYPVTKEGKPLYLLAQFNLSTIAELPEDFPTTGMLQFFIADDDLYGVDFDSREQDGFRVVYHEHIVNEMLEDLPKLSADNMLPVNKPIALIFGHRKFEYVSLNDYRQTDFDEAYDENMLDKIYDMYGGGGHKFGGYPHFTQWDPRDEVEELATYELLFQMDTDFEHGIMWGDCGVANFFIDPKDLRRRDFSKVFYSWDCS